MKKKLRTGVAALVVSGLLVLTTAAPANAFSRYVVCYWFPYMCTKSWSQVR